MRRTEGTLQTQRIDQASQNRRFARRIVGPKDIEPSLEGVTASELAFVRDHKDRNFSESQRHAMSAPFASLSA